VSIRVAYVRHLEETMLPETGTSSSENVMRSCFGASRQHTSACVSIRQHASACVSMRQHSIREHTTNNLFWGLERFDLIKDPEKSEEDMWLKQRLRQYLHFCTSKASKWST
jgi:hypothetical protein